ncbi:MAG TPA: ABC transporter ATP-binding protein [Burkholderiaceae bacterium]|nr:ABC transporter ATP-binding protein [Burkholderiaceae bacterium]
MDAMLEVRGLHKRFGGLRVLEDVDLAIGAGEIHCLIGPNGAGKSTLFKLMVGTYEPSQGQVLFLGEDITARRPYERVMRGMSIKMQVPSAFRELPVAQNLQIALQRRLPISEIPADQARLLALLDLGRQAEALAGDLSHGQQQWLEIGMALASSPKMLLLDEPTAGMSPEETFRTGELVQRLNAEGMTVLVVEHDMAFIRQVAQKVTVLHFGRVFAQGNIDQIVSDPRVAEIYLGKSHGE